MAPIWRDSPRGIRARAFILAHIGGGGDYMHTFAAVRDVPNIFPDLSGSGVDRGMLDAAVDALGAERLLWGSDLTMCTGLAKLRALDVIGLGDDEIEAIRWQNAARIFPAGSFPRCEQTLKSSTLPASPPRERAHDRRQRADRTVSVPPRAASRSGRARARARPRRDRRRVGRPSAVGVSIAIRPPATRRCSRRCDRFARPASSRSRDSARLAALGARARDAARRRARRRCARIRRSGDSGPHDVASMRELARRRGRDRASRCCSPFASRICASATRWIRPATSAAATVRALARAGDSVRLVVTAASREMIEEVHWGLTPDEQQRVFWDISWIWGPPEDHLAKLFRTIGSKRFVFGTQWPLRLTQTPRANLDLLPDDVARRSLADRATRFAERRYGATSPADRITCGVTVAHLRAISCPVQISRPSRAPCEFVHKTPRLRLDSKLTPSR